MVIDYGYNVKKTMTYVMGWYPEVSTWLAQWKIPQLDQWFSQLETSIEFRKFPSYLISLSLSSYPLLFRIITTTLVLLFTIS